MIVLLLSYIKLIFDDIKTILAKEMNFKYL